MPRQPARGGREMPGGSKQPQKAVFSAETGSRLLQHPDDGSGGFSVILPYPPTVNRIWRRVGAKTLLSAEGRAYRERVGAIVKAHGGRLPPPPHRVCIIATVPDRIRRDIDNLPKGILDAVYQALDMDDSVIVRLEIEKRGPDAEGPRVLLTVEEAR